MHPSPKLNRSLSLIAATIIGNVFPILGAELVCSAALDPVAITRDLDYRRPAAIGSEERAAILRSLPPQGQVRQLNLDDTHKLEGLGGVLRFHDRQTVYTVIVVDLPQARIGLFDKSVVMVSLPALRRLTAAEVQAMVAHEIGHEYVWNEYYAAKARGDGPCLRQLEFFCDAVAAITLHRAGLDPRQVASGLSHIRKFNRQFGTPKDDHAYPPIKERNVFIRKVIAAVAKESRHKTRAPERRYMRSIRRQAVDRTECCAVAR